MPLPWLHRLFVLFGVCLTAVLTFGPAPARAAGGAGVAGRPLQVCVLRDAPGMTAAQLFRQPGRFDCTTKQTAFGPGDYWVISERIGQRSRARQPLATRIGSLWQQGLELHILYADGQIVSYSSNNRGISELIQLGAIVEHPLPRAQPVVERVMWRVTGAANLRGIVVGARLATAAESAQSNLTMAALYAGFGGLCVALIIYNLALWGALRHRFQLAYCVMVAGLLIYTLSSSGALAWWWPDIPNNLRLRINHLMLASSAAAALVFARTFFEPRVFTGWLGKLCDTTVVALLAVGIGFFTLAPVATRAMDTIFSFSFLGVAALLGPVLWRAWTRQSHYLWLFAIAWATPIATAALRVMVNLGLIPWSFLLDNSTILAMTTEAVISSLAIAYRIRLLSRERDLALAGEIMARRLAEIDPLTGLLNRRAFLERVIGRQGEQQLLIADLDQFKRVNETLGHDGGDEVLRVFARVLRSCVPDEAEVARLGGEEFAVLSPIGVPLDPEAILARVRSTRMPFDLVVTTSIGVCNGGIASEPEWKRLYRGADAALFRAKAAGRDRVRRAGERDVEDAAVVTTPAPAVAA